MEPLTIISEYTCPPGCTQIAATGKTVTLAAQGGQSTATESLYVPDRQLDRYKTMMGQLF